MTAPKTVGDNSYQVRRMSALDQFDVARKWAPLFLWLSQGRKDVGAEAFSRAFCAVSTAVPKEDNDLAMALCLTHVTRQVSGDQGWAPVMVGGQLRFEDIQLGHLLQLVYHVIEEHDLIGFFKDPPATSGEGTGGA